MQQAKQKKRSKHVDDVDDVEPQTPGSEVKRKHQQQTEEVESQVTATVESTLPGKGKKRRQQVAEVQPEEPAATTGSDQVKRKRRKQAADDVQATAAATDSDQPQQKRERQVTVAEPQPASGLKNSEEESHSGPIAEEEPAAVSEEKATEGTEEADGLTGSLLELRRLLTPAAEPPAAAATLTAPADPEDLLDWTSRRYVVNATDPSVPLEKLTWPVHPAVEASLRKAGYHSLFPIQAAVIPLLLRCTQLAFDEDSPYSCDVCVAAPTGQGKTLAYAVPVVESLLDCLEPKLRALVLVPTRDLALQVFHVFVRLCTGLTEGVARVQVLCLTGEQSLFEERRRLNARPPDVVVCTPGRLADHVLAREASLDLRALRWFVADEADRLLLETSHRWLDVLERIDGFAQEGVLGHGGRAQKLLLSATMTWNPQKLAALKLRRPIYFSSSETGKHATPAELRQFYTRSSMASKPLVVLHILRCMLRGELEGLGSPESMKAVVFCPSVDTAHRLARLLQIFCNRPGKVRDEDTNGKVHDEDADAVQAEDPADDVPGLEAKHIAEFSSNLRQKQRTALLQSFRKAKVKCLVCSDVAARGIDIPEVSVVINYTKPPYLQNYIHRVGRTARAGRMGYTFTLVTAGGTEAFLAMLRESADCSARLQEHDVPREARNVKEPWYAEALRELERCLQLEDQGQQWQPSQTARKEIAGDGKAAGEAAGEVGGAGEGGDGEGGDDEVAGAVEAGGSGEKAEGADEAKSVVSDDKGAADGAVAEAFPASTTSGTMLDFVQAHRAALTKRLL